MATSRTSILMACWIDTVCRAVLSVFRTTTPVMAAPPQSFRARSYGAGAETMIHKSRRSCHQDYVWCGQTAVPGATAVRVAATSSLNSGSTPVDVLERTFD